MVESESPPFIAATSAGSEAALALYGTRQHGALQASRAFPSTPELQMARIANCCAVLRAAYEAQR